MSEQCIHASDALKSLQTNGTGVPDWRPVETAPKDQHLLLCHREKKWIRFGRWFEVQGGAWYYSGTNERSQYAQVRGDEPTHWAPMPELPA